MDGRTEQAKRQWALLFQLRGTACAPEGVSLTTVTERTRIALVGDSFTFGEDVAYEDTWGHLLEQALGSDAQVLNAGVGSYGLDQAFLRYNEDVRRWSPKVVILSFISADVVRTMSVYPFIAAPHWQIPFSKPRLVLRDGGLHTLNIPPVAPEAIFSKGSISELPFLEQDKGYIDSQWLQNSAQLSYLARAFMTLFPRWSPVLSDVSDETLVTLNASILKAFIGSVSETGAIPMVVYFPREELERPNLSLPLGKRVLQHAGIDYTDVTPCLLEVEPNNRFALGGHYSPKGNAAVTKCLTEVVRQAVAGSSS
ncbi:MAG: SGNH/GDSL hydrolase family protein [Nitrospira sp.]